MNDRPLAMFRRYLWQSKNIVFVYSSDQSKLLASMDSYNDSCNSATALDLEQAAALRELLLSACLASASQIDPDTWGWTIRLPFKRWGLFCGVEADGMVCGQVKILSKELAKDVVGGFSVQRVFENGPMRQSSLIPRDETPLYLVEQYFEESEQLPARLAIDENHALMALALPDADWDAVKSLSQAELIDCFLALKAVQDENDESSVEDLNLEEALDARADLSKDERMAMIKAKFAVLKPEKLQKTFADLKTMHEAVYYYACRCSLEQMRKLIANLPKEHEDELWGDDKLIDIQCPRCGSEYKLNKTGE